MKINKPYPYLCSDIDRQGRKRWRLRAPRRPTTTIKGEYGSPEFAANYRAAMEGERVRLSKGATLDVDAIFDRLLDLPGDA